VLHGRLLATLQVYQVCIAACWYSVEQGREDRLWILTSVHTPFLLGLCSGFTVAYQSNSNFNINQGVVEQNVLPAMTELVCHAGAGHPLKGFPLAWLRRGGMWVNEDWKQAGKLSSEVGSGGTNPKNSRL